LNTAHTKPVVRQLLIVAMALGLWAALVLVVMTLFMLVGSFSWREAFVQAVFFWGLWVFLMPALAWLSFRHPFEPSRFRLNLGLHLLCCVAVVVISQIAFRNFIPLTALPAGEASRIRELGLPPPGHETQPPKGFLSLRAALDIIAYWSLVAACQAVVNFRRSQQRERRAAELEAGLARSKLQALRLQINPHFLFNTLNAISTLIYVNPRGADEMLGDLSELLRHSLDSAEEQEIPLARELQFIRAYIGIEQKRFGDRLRVEQNVPDELLNALVPALILQPLVENAIRHGIEPQRAPGLVKIEAKRQEQHLLLTVHDNGKGPPADAAARAKGLGIGLTNTRSRLRELYGKDQRFSFAKGEPTGCVVEIRLPFHLQPLHVPSSAETPS
jgi:signal transduction histidine kinase